MEFLEEETRTLNACPCSRMLMEYLEFNRRFRGASPGTGRVSPAPDRAESRTQFNAVAGQMSQTKQGENK
jgi:hypothetical protein